jgi:hypothetical protein
VETKPKRVLFNPGTENPELYLLELNNIKSEVACTGFIDYKPLLNTRICFSNSEVRQKL